MPNPSVDSASAAVELSLAAAGDPAAATAVLSADGDAVVQRSILPGGVRVLTESMPGQRSVAFGIWVGVGSRDESEDHYGSTHFLEHLLFKGTPTRSAMDIASAFDEVGGESNAATGKEHTSYYARVLDEDLPMAASVIGDMVTSATLEDDDIESERTVIVEELAMNDDDATDVVHERFAELVLPDHPLGRPIGGTAESIMAVTPDAIREHYREHYRSDTLVVTAAGGVEHGAVCDLVTDALDAAKWERQPQLAPSGRRNTQAAQIAQAPGQIVVQRDIEQANIIVGCPSITATDDQRFPMFVLNAVLGGGMSSRLFQEVREKRGLAYSVYSFAAGYSDSGYFGMYAGCTPSKATEVISLMTAELEKLAEAGPDADELQRAHGQLCGGMVLGMEDSGSRMSRLGKAELVHGRFLDLDGALAKVRAVSAQDVQNLAAELASRPRSLAVVGPFEPEHSFI